MSSRRLCLALALSLLAGSASALDPELKLEGRDDARARLDALCFKPLDPKLLDGLSGWNGDRPAADSLKGKPVLLVTWACWYKTSFDAMKIAESLHQSLGPKGLVVIGIHSPQHADRAADAARTLGVTFPWAVDDGSALRKGLLSDQDPDVYLIDRAGNLRFADIATSSMEAAAIFLTDETAEAASKATPAAEKPAPTPVAASVADPEAYKAATWPKHNSPSALGARKSFQGKPLPKPLGKEKYLSEAPSRDGKVTILDFWATWCGPCRMAMPKLDKLYQKHSDRLVVIGISDEPEKTIKDFLKKNPHKYPQAIDTTRTVNNALQIEGIPHVVILSTDGIIRWQGNPLEPDFERIVSQVIEADPGARAAADAPDPASADKPADPAPAVPSDHP